MMSLPSLEESAGWPMDDDPEVITELDIDWLADIRQADEEAEAEREADWDIASCCGGRDWTCGHFGHGVLTMKDYNAKYGLWDEP
jgi:hypothetical protein